MNLLLKNNSIFAKTKFPKQSVILEFKGDLFSKDTIIHKQSQILQIGDNTFLGPSGSFDDYIRHSCNPNAYLHIVGKRAFLYALCDILPNQEITFDYSTSSTNSKDEWNLICKCNFNLCRKEISGLQYLSPELKLDYLSRDIIPYFLRDNKTKIIS